MSLNRQVANVGTMATIATVVTLIGAYIYYRRRKKHVPEEWTAVGKVKQLYLYPLKSGRRREIQSAECTKYGISVNEKNVELRDRFFVVYGEKNNEFKTARTFPNMVLIETSVNDNGEFVFTAPGQKQLVVKIPTTSEKKPVRVTLHFKEPCEAIDCGDEAATWFSQYIMGTPNGLRLGYNKNIYKRNIEKHFYKFKRTYHKLRNDCAGLYQDLTSYHLVSQSSVDALNANLTEPVSANNFRPNILVEGKDLKPHAEEDWDWIKIGDAVFRNVKPCTRCVLTTVDPEGGVLSKKREPLKALESTNNLKDPEHVKCEGKMAVMGIHLGLKRLGQIRVNDEVYVA